MARMSEYDWTPRPEDIGKPLRIKMPSDYSNTPDCPRCAELRAKAVKMFLIKRGPIPQAYECPSCDYVIVLRHE
jgi:hypothetical protein